jgi:hypothetical protein
MPWVQSPALSKEKVKKTKQKQTKKPPKPKWNELAGDMYIMSDILEELSYFSYFFLPF